MKKIDGKFNDAAGAGDIHALKTLLDQGADRNALDENGKTALHAAASNGHIGAVQVLLEEGVPPDLRGDERQSTPLMEAAYKGYIDIIEVLLDAGADPALRGGDMNYSAQRWAEHKNKHACAERLRNAVKTKHPRRLFSKSDEVVITNAVYDRTLQEIFNFHTRMRTVFVRKNDNEPVEAVNHAHFSALSEAELRRAFDIYKKRGGTLAEEDVFENFIAKPMSIELRKP